MTPWKWNDEIKLWVNSVTDETMTTIEYDDARCKQIARLEEENKVLREKSDSADGLMRAIKDAIANV